VRFVGPLVAQLDLVGLAINLELLRWQRGTRNMDLPDRIVRVKPKRQELFTERRAIALLLESDPDGRRVIPLARRAAFLGRRSQHPATSVSQFKNLSCTGRSLSEGYHVRVDHVLHYFHIHGQLVVAYGPTLGQERAGYGYHPVGLRVR